MKTFIASLTLLLLLSLPVNAQFIPGVELTETEELGDGLYAFRYGPYRNIFLVTDDGVVATDPLDVKAATLLREAIAKITDQPVKYVAYSHSHWDHASGGQIFKDEGAKFVAQRECLINMTETRHPDVVLPDIVFDETYSIKLGAQSLDMYYFGPSHDDCMTVMIAKPANIMFIVDITSAPTGWEMEYNPTMAEGYLYNIVQYLLAVEALAAREGVETIVSGHLAVGFAENGKMFGQPSTGPIAAVREKREFWEILFAAVAAEMAAGTSAEDVPDKLLASAQFKIDFLDRMEENELPMPGIGWQRPDMKILLRRIATYNTTGR